MSHIFACHTSEHNYLAVFCGGTQTSWLFTSMTQDMTHDLPRNNFRLVVRAGPRPTTSGAPTTWPHCLDQQLIGQISKTKHCIDLGLCRTLIGDSFLYSSYILFFHSNLFQREISFPLLLECYQEVTLSLLPKVSEKIYRVYPGRREVITEVKHDIYAGCLSVHAVE